MQLEDLIMRLRIEENNLVSEKKLRNQSIESKANVIEQVQKINKKKKRFSQGLFLGLKGGISKKFMEKCYVCNKPGHRAKDCCKRNNQKNFNKKVIQANMTKIDHLSENVFEMNLSAMISEVNLVKNTKEWWVDTKITRHVCSDKKMFSFNQSMNNG